MVGYVIADVGLVATKVIGYQAIDRSLCVDKENATDWSWPDRSFEWVLLRCRCDQGSGFVVRRGRGVQST